MDPYSLLRAVEEDLVECVHRDYDAAVAVIYEAPSGSFILIERVERQGDPWSGHIAFPGGFRKAGENSYETAVREAMEEISVNLDGELHLGSIGVWITRGSVRVVPHIFIARGVLETKPGVEIKRIMRIRPEELSEIPCPDHIKINPCLYTQSCGDKVIWGLTARILARLMRHERSER